MKKNTNRPKAPGKARKPSADSPLPSALALASKVEPGPPEPPPVAPAVPELPPVLSFLPEQLAKQIRTTISKLNAVSAKTDLDEYFSSNMQNVFQDLDFARNKLASAKTEKQRQEAKIVALSVKERLWSLLDTTAVEIAEILKINIPSFLIGTVINKIKLFRKLEDTTKAALWDVLKKILDELI